MRDVNGSNLHFSIFFVIIFVILFARSNFPTIYYNVTSGSLYFGLKCNTYKENIVV